jgi:mannose-1-phosphate guanylyltransferase
MLHAIIMAGGSGTRFWPKSRRDRPKQLLRLVGESTMLEQTVARITPLVPLDRVVVVTGADQAEDTLAQLPALPAANLIAEPCPRDTAPCVGLAAGFVASKDPDATMVVMPADHVIEPAEAFRTAVRAAVSLVDDDPGALVTFGITPTRPETGYGYIERGRLLERRDGVAVYPVEQFREKPDRSTAEAFLKAGNFVWNSGIFVWRAATILERLRIHCLKLALGLEPILRSLGTPLQAEVLAREFPRLKRIPIDKAVMEHAQKVTKVLEVPYNWNDVGDWRALASLLKRDEAGNAVEGHVVAQDTTGSIIISDDGGLVATLGVDDLVIVHSGRATLVARKDQLDKLKSLVEGLRDAGYGSHA